MTYCVGMLLQQGLVFLSDSRTNAGVDNVSTFRKMKVWSREGDRVLVLLSSGNLAITQAVINILEERMQVADAALNLWAAPTLFEAATCVGEALREVRRRDLAALEEMGVEFNAALILGGQIAGEPHRLFHIYAAGNFIEATPETPFFQIGESKYGKPILDRVIEPGTSLVEAVKCGLISMDSTIRSNLSVGLPLDVLTYARDALRVGHQVSIGADDPYYAMIHSRWSEELRRVFLALPNPDWD